MLVPNKDFLWSVGFTQFLCLQVKLHFRTISPPHKKSEFAIRIFRTQITWISKIMLECLKNYNVTEMLFVMNEESGVNNLKNVVLNNFFLNNDVMTFFSF